MNLFDEPISYLSTVLSSGARVLDVGGRDGVLSQRFAEEGHVVTMIDPETPSKEFINIPVDFVQTPVEEFNANQPFDLVFARLVEHFMKGKTVCENIRELNWFLTASGVLYLTVFGKNDPWSRSPTVLEEARQCFEQLGLKVLQFDEHEFDGETYVGKSKHWHILVFVAQK